MRPVYRASQRSPSTSRASAASSPLATSAASPSDAASPGGLAPGEAPPHADSERSASPTVIFVMGGMKRGHDARASDLVLMAQAAPTYLNWARKVTSASISAGPSLSR